MEHRWAELEEVNSELMRIVAHNNELEMLLREKDDELELSCGVAAENVDLQRRVAELTAELDARVMEINGLKGELSVSADKVVELQGQVVPPSSEEVVHLSQPSSSRSLSGRDPRRNAYEIWVFAEAKLDVYRYLHVEGRATEEEVQARRTETRAAHESCGYYPDSPDGGDSISGDVNHLNSESWYNYIYPPGGDE